MLQATFTPQVGETLGGENLQNLRSASLRHDKFLFIGKTSKKEQLDEVCRLANANRMPTKRMPCIPGSTEFVMRLGSRLMVDMAGGVLENAGLCLHPHFNCPFIPGSAVKGVARHRAWVEWRKSLESKGNVQATTVLAERMSRIFGFPTGDKLLDQFIETNCSINGPVAGSVVFIQAMPADDQWRLVTDVLTPHGGNDYTNPVPSFFIAVDKGANFRFAVRATNRAEENDIDDAVKWLKDGLASNGAGAKTTAGYGWFEAELNNDEKQLSLRLSSPGFLGGASHDKKFDTELRIPALRGMLRWWWRTLYRGIMPETTVREIESVIWGSTSSASLLSLRIRSAKDGVPKPQLFNHKYRNAPKHDFARAHNIARPPKFTTPGVFYMSYGMDETIDNKPRQRHYLPQETSWTVTINSRDGRQSYRISFSDGRSISITSEQIVEQALLAFSLLCKFGGIGSKARKGFGSVTWDSAWDLAECRKRAEVFCHEAGLPVQTHAAAYSFETALVHEIELPWSDAWTVIDRLGLAVQKVTKTHKHCTDKAALGLPRKIHGPKNIPMRHQKRHSPPKSLMPDLAEARNGKKTRFAAPVWYHIDTHPRGATLRITAFPSDMICDIETSRKMLKELMGTIQADLRDAAKDGSNPQGPKSAPGRASRRRHQQPQITKTESGIKAGDRITAILLEEKTKKGGWKVKTVTDNLKGAIVNSHAVPNDKKAGDEVEVIVNSANPTNPSFRWP